MLKHFFLIFFLCLLFPNENIEKKIFNYSFKNINPKISKYSFTVLKSDNNFTKFQLNWLPSENLIISTNYINDNTSKNSSLSENELKLLNLQWKKIEDDMVKLMLEDENVYSTFSNQVSVIVKALRYTPVRQLYVEGCEADDAIGLLATGEHKDNCVIISGDKDMRTIPAWQCCIIDDQIEYVDEQKADYNFCTQALTGDQTDGYKGCVGVGAVKASRVLNDKKNIAECWEAVLREYYRNKYSIDDAYHQARLARILREGEYNYQTNQPKLWDFQYEHYRNFRER